MKVPAPSADVAPIAPPPPAPPIVAPVARAFPAAGASAPAADATSERTESAPEENRLESVAGGARDETVAESPRSAARRSSNSAFAAPALGALSKSEPSAGMPSDRAARLRAAAAAGRATEVEALLDQGAPVDAPDGAGDTALMKSIQADHPAAAAVLRRHGANLDHRNHAGESARDIARSKNDPDLDQAIGLRP